MATSLLNRPALFDKPTTGDIMRRKQVLKGNGSMGTVSVEL
nr:hypothetical protein [uncultured Dysgonomonas sp.]